MKTAAALCLAGLLGAAQAFVAPQFSAPAARVSPRAARGAITMENFNLPLGEVSDTAGIVHFRCLDVLGRAIYVQSHTAFPQRFSADTPSLPIPGPNTHGLTLC